MIGNKVIFISLIGKGRKKTEGTKGYYKTYYFFDEIQDVINTSFFGSALYKVLLKQGYDVDKWLIFGTSESSWSELLYLLEEKYHNEMIALYDRVYDKENKGISKELLYQWEKTLQQIIPSIRLIIVDSLDYEIYINHMIKEIPNEQRNIVLDITHAFRHMPVIMAFSLMVLKHIKNISNIIVYYGALELKKNRYDENEFSPVLKIDFINKLVSYAENLAVFNNSGYFPGILEDLGILDVDKTYFRLEMNRQPRKDLELINNKLEDKTLVNDYQGNIAKYIKKEIEPLVGVTLDKRMIERAMFFCNKNQYLKSLILFYEGLIVAIGRKYGLDSRLDYKMNQEIRKYIQNNKKTVFKNKQQADLYYELEYTRNAAVHGSRSKGIQNYVEQQDQFETLFKGCLEIYEYIVGGKL